MENLEQSWEGEVKRSRIRVLPDQDSYLDVVNVPVWEIIEHLAQGWGERQLKTAYPSLTPADIRACSLFVYLRSIQKI